MTSTLHSNSWVESSGINIRTDTITRRLYATDASIYEVFPTAVAFPKGAGEIAKCFQYAIEENLSVTPRGSGSGLAGGAIGDGLILDCQRNNQRIHSFDRERRTVRVGPGVVLDALNAFLRPHGFQFGPDVATSSRATLGGMIANDSSGARVAAYGTTGDHVRALDLVVSDGRMLTLNESSERLNPLIHQLLNTVQTKETLIRETYPDGMIKRWHGYGLRRWLEYPEQWTHLLAGSEGTLAVIAEAELNVIPLPMEKGLGLLFFDSVEEALQASVAVADLKPSAIEHIDRILFDQTRGQLAFQKARDLLRLDDQPCESILMVEFQSEVKDRLEQLRKRALGQRCLMLSENDSMNLVWHLRKAGLSLLTGCKGSAKPTTGIEDTAVRPEVLPEYVGALKRILDAQQLQACFYGHAASGLLHVRPVIDLQKSDDVSRFRLVADEVSALVKSFKGSLAAEHGVGMARTEYLADHVGPELIELHHEIKRAFDPEWRLNPGKVIDQGKYRFDSHLRRSIDTQTSPTSFSTELQFAVKDSHWSDNLAQCNGCGGCRKTTGTMCPTFQATGEEVMSTRGRANLIRSWTQTTDKDSASNVILQEALKHCLSCKACKTECPSNVDIALIKAELQHAIRKHSGVSMAQWLFGHVDQMAELGSLFPHWSNRIQSWAPLRRWIEKPLNISPKRPLPNFTEQRFDHWFDQRHSPEGSNRKLVYLWDDTFVRHYDPPIGRAAVRVLERLGYEVRLLRQRKCCGRPSFSQGDLDRARRLGVMNIELILRHPVAPVLFLEPSCYSMFREDYRELNVPEAEKISDRCFLFEQFLADQATSHPEWQDLFLPIDKPLNIHAHCHAKALCDVSFMSQFAETIWPENGAQVLPTGCCGMAGAFGATQSEYDLSIKVGQNMVGVLDGMDDPSHLIASGTSCRHQIEHLTMRKPQHFAEILADSLIAHS